jgi:hypothetical protein
VTLILGYPRTKARLGLVFAFESDEHMRMIAANSRRPGLTSIRALIALAMTVSLVSLHSSVAKESGTPEIPLPPAPIVQNIKVQQNVQQEAGRRDDSASDRTETCMEPEDERVCEMEMELGEVTFPR